MEKTRTESIGLRTLFDTEIDYQDRGLKDMSQNVDRRKNYYFAVSSYEYQDMFGVTRNE